MQAELVAPAYDPGKAGKDGAIVDRNLLTSFLWRYSSSDPTCWEGRKCSGCALQHGHHKSGGFVVFLLRSRSLFSPPPMI